MWILLKLSMTESCDSVSSALESSLYHNVHAILRELETDPQAASACNRGMLRWTLHNRVERNPTVCVPLLKVLVKELERAERMDCRIRLAPLLHTLWYTVLQSAFIPEELCQRIYVCLKRLITLPAPHCALALRYARQIKLERNAAGILFQRRVMAEHSLRHSLHPLQEKVFVFVDPCVVPCALVSSLRSDVSCSCPGGDSAVLKGRILLHTLRAGLGKQCRVDQLSGAITRLGAELETHFQNIVTATEQQTDGRRYRATLQQIYQDVLTEGVAASPDPALPTVWAESQLPSPEVSFHVWDQEEDIWRVLVTFALMLPADRTSLEEEEQLRRSSVMSTDSGIESDMLTSDFSCLLSEGGGRSFSRRRGQRWPRAANRTTLMMEAISGDEGVARDLTARLVLMGDDRTLGRLAKMLHSIRKREARHLLLTRRVKLETYYIPLTEPPPPPRPPAQGDAPAAEDMLTLARRIGDTDPWYDCNINALAPMILTLAQTRSSGSSDHNSFLRDVVSYYTRVSRQPLPLPVYGVKVCVCAAPAPLEDVFVAQLDVSFPEAFRAALKHALKGSLRYRRSPAEGSSPSVRIRYRKASISGREEEKTTSASTFGLVISVLPSDRPQHSISVRFQDTKASLRVLSISVSADRVFSVRLDKDPRRMFTGVQSIHVSPCLDPAYQHQSREDEPPQEKFLSKSFTLPINTFCCGDTRTDEERP